MPLSIVSLWLPFFAVLFAIQPCTSQAADLVKEGRSAYVIYHEAQAPASVKEAAKELQRVFKAATDVQLPIVQAPSDFMIVLGDSEVARKTGIETSKLAHEHFQIRTDGPHVFIAGNDTRDGTFTEAGGVSDGTYYGVMTFLEHFMNVRWLMPGAWGEDIPRQTALSLDAIDLKDGPDFPSRSMTLGFGGVSNAWLRHIGNTPSRQPIVRSHFNHAWNHYHMRERLQGHPEYMALVKGKRTDINDWHHEMQEMKFCTTNAGLIDLYAKGILEAMAEKPEQEMWPIAPSDGGGWCECEKCTALDETSTWAGNRMYGKISKTPRVLTFYNEVAKRVKAKQPNKKLGGYVYASYTYPPAKEMAIEPNLFLMLAVRAYYGFTLYREELAEEVPALVAAWDAKMKGRMGWVDYSTYVGMDTPMGTPYPLGKPILKLLFPSIHKRGWQAMYWGSTGNVQGWGSLHNYLVAKLMWHADADVDALAKEWLQRAYGPGGPRIGEVYDLLEKKLTEYKRTSPKYTEYDATPAQVKAVHLPLLPKIEALYREALAQCESDVQRTRLQMFGDNFVLLHWNLRKAGWLEKPEQSLFYRTDADFKTFIEANSVKPSINKTNSKPEVFLQPQLGIPDAKAGSVDK